MSFGNMGEKQKWLKYSFITKDHPSTDDNLQKWENQKRGTASRQLS